LPARRKPSIRLAHRNPQGKRTARVPRPIRRDQRRDGPARVAPARLPRNADTPFDIAPDADARRDMATRLGVSAIRKLRLTGRLCPVGERDWLLDAHLGATVVQPCVATLAPVTTRIGEPVARRYLAGFSDPGGADVEMPEDDTVEALPDGIDLEAVLEEALALALPPYPRAPGASEIAFALGPPGAAPMTDADARPLAGLAGLRDRPDAGKPDAD